jgi:hypothetical protein
MRRKPLHDCKLLQITRDFSEIDKDEMHQVCALRSNGTSTAISHSPSINDPDEGGVVLVPKIARKGMLCEHIPVKDPPAPPVRRP